MNFLVPSFLAALFVIAIPILIHLFYFKRYKKLEFTNVHFLRVLKEEANSKSKLKNLLILLCRIFALIFLVIAFCQPFFENEEKQGSSQKTISIYLDNSFSMANESSYGKLLNEGKQIVRKIIQENDPTTEYQILSNEFLSKNQQLIDQSVALDYVSAIDVVPECRNYNSILTRQLNALRKSNAVQKEIYIVSDFQQSIGKLDQLYVDSNIKINWIPLKGNEINNVTIDSAWFSTPFIDQNQTIELVVRYKQSNDGYEGDVNVHLKINGVNKAISSFQFGTKKEVIDTIAFALDEVGTFKGELKVDDYPIQFDDNYFFSFDIAENISVLNIKEKNASHYLKAIFDEKAYFNYEEQAYTSLDFGSLQRYDVVILNELTRFSSGLLSALKSYATKGGNIIIIPSNKSDLLSYQNLSNELEVGVFQQLVNDSTEIDEINYYSEIFKYVFDKKDKRVDLPKIHQFYSIVNHSSFASEPLLSLTNDQEIISAYKKERSMIYLFGIPLDKDFSDLQSHAIFVPMIYNMVAKSTMSNEIAYTIGKDEFVEHPRNQNSQDILKIRNDHFEIIPELKNFNNRSILVLHNQIKEPGYYNIQSGGKDVRTLAFNYSRLESELTFLESAVLKEIGDRKGVNIITPEINNNGEVDIEMNEDTSLWKLCIIFVIIFLALEMFLIKKL